MFYPLMFLEKSICQWMILKNTVYLSINFIIFKKQLQKVYYTFKKMCFNLFINEYRKCIKLTMTFYDNCGVKIYERVFV